MSPDERSSYNAYMREYMARRYKERRAKAIEQLGGECMVCGTTEQLEFDHTNPNLKSWSMGKILAGGSAAKVAEELKKCVLLCKECHTLKTKVNGDTVARRERECACECGRTFTDRLAFAGHKRWCMRS